MALMYAIYVMLSEATPSNRAYEMQHAVVQHIPLTMLHNRHEHKTQPNNVLVSAMRPMRSMEKTNKKQSETKINENAKFANHVISVL